MVTAAKASLLRQQSRQKGCKQHKILDRRQFNAIKHQLTDLIKVLLKTNRELILALLDLQSQGGAQIDSKFIHPYHI